VTNANRASLSVRRVPRWSSDPHEPTSGHENESNGVPGTRMSQRPKPPIEIPSSGRIGENRRAAQCLVGYTGPGEGVIPIELTGWGKLSGVQKNGCGRFRESDLIGNDAGSVA